MKKALYAGSFNPFTNGHLEMVKEASNIFDEVYVCIAVNAEKALIFNEDELKKKIDAISRSIGEANIPNVKVIFYSGMIANLCKELGVRYLVRGLRNTSDYLYEENIAKINCELNPNLMTVYLRSNNEVISSSLIRELLKYNQDISKYVPGPILELITENEKNKKN